LPKDKNKNRGKDREAGEKKGVILNPTDCKHSFAHCYYSKRTRENVYVCVKCGYKSFV